MISEKIHILVVFFHFSLEIRGFENPSEFQNIRERALIKAASTAMLGPSLPGQKITGTVSLWGTVFSQQQRQQKMKKI